MADSLHHDVPDSNPILAKYFFRFFFSIPFFYKFFTHICQIILWPTEWIVTNTRTYMVTKSYQEYPITCVNSILWLKNPVNYNRIYTKLYWTILVILLHTTSANTYRLVIIPWNQFRKGRDSFKPLYWVSWNHRLEAAPLPPAPPNVFLSVFFFTNISSWISTSWSSSSSSSEPDSSSSSSSSLPSSSSSS